MAIPALSDSLRQLATSIDLDYDSLPQSFGDLVDYVRHSIASFQGLQLTVVDHGWPVTFTDVVAAQDQPAASSLRLSLSLLVPDADRGSFVVDHGWPVTFTDVIENQDRPAASTLRLSLSLLVPGADRGSFVVFLAGQPGAFVDLAADLSHLLDVPATALAERTFDLGPEAPGIQLDGTPVPDASVPAVTGLAEWSTINRAVGVLIERGWLLDDAYDAVREGAARAGVPAHVFAARLMDG